MTGLLPLGTVLLGLVLLAAWTVVLVWVASRLLRIVARGTGWQATAPRAVALTFVLLLAAIHFGNWLITLADDRIAGARSSGPSFPPAFLIASVAIAVGVAVIRARRG
ncbi:hypothetical protein EYB45_10830 [Erythrobacteraceae bacterium CFH 75059]|uniref:hypothetical protein n=1 Tax=Qipengyuania thermophila TaxID=2509361 RepID=UPI0010226804|nr:hypothetical protein [Qipengyuania thermophila]TCD01912.1 hypothetical protein EYB45_10830 [Erythrobacteraceae bacterium CFH 75059]